MKSPLIIRLPNWVGDVVMCLPAIQKLQELDISFILMGRPWIHDLLQSLKVSMMTWPKDHLKAIQTLKTLPAENILLFTNSFSSACIAKLSHKKALGFAKDGRSWLMQTAISKPKGIHETDIFNFLTEQCLKIWYPKKTFDSFSKIPQLNIESDFKILREKFQLPEQYIVLCPFAHGHNPQGKPKKWPFWSALSNQIQELNPIICPGPSEINESNTFFSHIFQLPHLNLHEYLNILSHAHMIIANDSGPMHMACAVNRPTIAIFGATDEKRTGPRNAILLGQEGEWPSVAQVLQQIKILLTNPY